MSRRIVGTLVAAALTALVLTGCIEEPTPTPTPTSSASPSATVAPPADPELDLEGTAADNLDYFDFVNRRLIDAGGTLDGRAFVDNLVAAGFPKTDLEVTRDRTAINLAADNIQFSARINGGCLIGQYGNVGYASTTAPLLATGLCLVGDTRPIDW